MSTLARDVMQRNTLTIPSNMPFLEIQHVFVVAGIDGAPVIDSRGKVVGIISAIDLLRAADQAWDEDADDDEAVEPTERFDSLTAEDIATPEVVWVAPETPADRVATLMRREGIHRVLVGADGHLDGIVTTFDLLQSVKS